MPKRYKLHKPEEGIEYKFAMPETGRIVTFRYLCVTAEGRLAFQSRSFGNVETLTPERFSYLYANCLIEKKKITENLSDKKEGKKHGKKSNIRRSCSSA